MTGDADAGKATPLQIRPIQAHVEAEIEPYCYNPVPGAKFMELTL